MPVSKISETLIDFAKPPMDFFGADMPPETMREMFKIATTVWNAVGFEQLGRGSQFIDEVRASMSAPDMFVMRGLVDVLIEQKRNRFAGDLRMISHQEVVVNQDGSYSMRAEDPVMPSHIN